MCGGLGLPSKRFLAKDFLFLHHADICCLQESKLSSVDLMIWRSIGGSRLKKFAFLPAIGTAGGIIIRWNSLSFDKKVIHVGSYCLSIEFRNRVDNVTWVRTLVYGPNARHLKQGFWREIRSCQPGSGLPWVICGNFNSIFDPSDKLDGNFNREDIRLAQALLSDLQLMEPPFFEKRFSGLMDN